MRPPFLFVALHFAATALIAQSNLGSVEGKVVNLVTGAPVKRAVVNLRSSTGQYASFTVTDLLGKFHIDNVPPAKYSAFADAEGFASGSDSRTVKLFTVGTAQEITGVELLAPPFNVISGKVVDEDQEPLEGVSVTAMRYTYNNGAKLLQSFSSAQTDDRGEYRIFDMQPGRYVLAAIAPNWKIRQALTQGDDHMHSTIPEEAYGAVLYPGVPEVSQASTHDLKPGEEWIGADFKLRKVPLFHIRGRLNNPVLPGGARVSVQMEKCDGRVMPGVFSQTLVDRQDGVFDIAVAPGEYCLIGRDSMHNAIALKQPVTIKDADLTGIILTPPSPFSVKGSITFDGTPPDHLAYLSVGLQTEDNAQRTAQVADDLTFQIDYVFPGRHSVVTPTAAPLLYVKSIVYGGEDVSSGLIPNMETGVPLSIVMGTDPGEVDGTLQAGSLEPGSPVQVVVIPDDAHAARTDLARYASSFAGGTYRIQGLAPGDYKVFALSGPDFEDTRDRDLLKLLEGQAANVTVHPSGHEQAPVTPIAASDIERAKGKLK